VERSGEDALHENRNSYHIFDAAVDGLRVSVEGLLVRGPLLDEDNLINAHGSGATMAAWRADCAAAMARKAQAVAAEAALVAEAAADWAAAARAEALNEAREVYTSTDAGK
jgi:hypothetical protein